MVKSDDNPVTTVRMLCEPLHDKNLSYSRGQEAVKGNYSRLSDAKLFCAPVFLLNWAVLAVNEQLVVGLRHGLDAGDDVQLLKMRPVNYAFKCFQTWGYISPTWPVGARRSRASKSLNQLCGLTSCCLQVVSSE